MQDTIVHDGSHISTGIAEVAGDVPCFSANSFSKSMLCPGWRVGWLCLQDPEGKLDNIKPYSKEDPEGEAILIKELKPETHLWAAYWRVRFTDDIKEYGENCETYERWVMSDWKI